MTTSYEDKKQMVINAAIKAIGRYGYHKTTLEDIASQMGIKKNSLYYYFPSKEALLNEIIMRESEILISELKKITEKDIPVSKKITDVFKFLLYYSKERSSLYAVSLETFLEIGEIIHQSFNEMSASIERTIDSILKEGVKQGVLKKHNSKEVSENLLLMFSSLEYKEYHYNNIKSFDDIDLTKLEKRIVSLTGMVMDGLKSDNN